MEDLIIKFIFQNPITAISVSFGIVGSIISVFTIIWFLYYRFTNNVPYKNMQHLELIGLLLLLSSTIFSTDLSNGYFAWLLSLKTKSIMVSQYTLIGILSIRLLWHIISTKND